MSTLTDPLHVLAGDCLHLLPTLPPASVQCVVTSPPYWGLRDYGVPPTAWPEVTFAPMAGLPPLTIPAMECCHGLERDPWAWVGHEVLLWREVRRVLKADGTCWVNLGDSYASTWSCGRPNAVGAAACDHGQRQDRKQSGLKEKDLCGMPWRLAFALQADGWHLRSDIIWHKPNPMPESVRDRPTKAHEYLFLLSASERYYYDAEAIREKASESTHARLSQNVQGQVGSARANGGAKTNGNMKAVARKRVPSGWAECDRGEKIGRYPRVKDNASMDSALAIMPLDRNKRTVWSIPTYSFSEAHFATFPPDLVRPCILAGSRPGETVLDPFGGSGTTGQVALELGRHAILCELNPAYRELIARRTRVTPGLGL